MRRTIALILLLPAGSRWPRAAATPRPTATTWSWPPTPWARAPSEATTGLRPRPNRCPHNGWPAGSPASPSTPRCAPHRDTPRRARAGLFRKSRRMLASRSLRLQRTQAEGCVDESMGVTLAVFAPAQRGHLRDDFSRYTGRHPRHRRQRVNRTTMTPAVSSKPPAARKSHSSRRRAARLKRRECRGRGAQRLSGTSARSQALLLS